MHNEYKFERKDGGREVGRKEGKFNIVQYNLFFLNNLIFIFHQPLLFPFSSCACCGTFLPRWSYALVGRERMRRREMQTKKQGRAALLLARLNAENNSDCVTVQKHNKWQLTEILSSSPPLSRPSSLPSLTAMEVEKIWTNMHTWMAVEVQ